jgi:hypothetical protein
VAQLIALTTSPTRDPREHGKQFDVDQVLSVHSKHAGRTVRLRMKYVTPDGEVRLEYQGPMVPGPLAFTYPVPVVIDNYGGSGAERARNKDAGLEHDVEIGQLFTLDGRTYRLTEDVPLHYPTLTLVEDLMCENCRDAVTREGEELVGSDGEVTCPDSTRPHGPAVPDTAVTEDPDLPLPEPARPQGPTIDWDALHRLMPAWERIEASDPEDAGLTYPYADSQALEIEQVTGNSEVLFTVRTWDCTHGLASEVEVATCKAEPDLVGDIGEAIIKHLDRKWQALDGE